MKTYLKVIGAVFLTAIVIFILFLLILGHLPEEERKDVGLSVGETGTTENWEMTLTNLEYQPNSDKNKTNIVITVDINYKGDEEVEYVPVYTLWYKKYLTYPPCINIDATDYEEKEYIFNADNRKYTVKETFEADNKALTDPVNWFMIALNNDIKYVITD